jgi:hypothetical protein
MSKYAENFSDNNETQINQALIRQSRNGKNEILPHPKWHDCFAYPGGPNYGQILVSFDIISANEFFKQKIESVDLGNFISKTWINFEI